MLENASLAEFEVCSERQQVLGAQTVVILDAKDVGKLPFGMTLIFVLASQKWQVGGLKGRRRSISGHAAQRIRHIPLRKTKFG